ncbi:MAG: S-layer homology domain-containing protein [Firmicutes bacterium]|nr:S-layer homology domain-containing protein [Bacillota bacterium]
MNKFMKNFGRSGIALILTICLVFGLCATGLAAQGAKEINYVSLGDSMTNGYGLTNYGNNGINQYGEEAYPNQFAQYLADRKGVTVNHSQLAMSAMRVLDLHFILEFPIGNTEAANLVDGKTWDKEAWETTFPIGDNYTWSEFGNGYRFLQNCGGTNEAAKMYQEAIANADVISIGSGNADFGVFLMGRIMNAVGTFGGSAEKDAWMDLNRAVAECDPEVQKIILDLKAEADALVAEKLAENEALAEREDLFNALVDAFSYTVVNFAVNYVGLIERVVELAPDDVEIMIVGLMNTMAGMDMTIEIDGETTTIPMSSVLGLLINPMNTYISTLPTIMQTVGMIDYDDATFYYAEASEVECMVSTYEEALKNPESVVRDRFVTEIVGENGNGMVWSMIAPMFNGLLADYGLSLVPITLADIQAYESGELTKPEDANKAISCAVYLAFEDAIVKGSKNSVIPIDSFLTLATGLDNVFGGVAEELAGLPDAVMKDVTEKGTAEVEAWAINPENAATINQVAQMAGIMGITDQTLIAQFAFAYANFSVSDPDEVLNTLTNYFAGKYMVSSMCEILTPALSNALTSDDTLMGLLHLFGRMLIGNGLGAHPSVEGHNELSAAVIEAYDYGYTSEDALIDLSINLTKVAVYLLITYGPDMYEEFMSDPENVEALKAALLDLKAYLETTYPEESEIVYDVLRDVESLITYIEENPEEVEAALEYIYTEATTGEYVRCSDHYYVALGGYTTDDGYFVKELANNYGIEYKNLGDKKLTFEGMEDYIAKNAKEIAKASFITYNMDASYFVDYVLGRETKQWERYMTAEEIEQVKIIKAKVLRVMRRHMDTETIEALIPTVENMSYAAVAYGVETVKAVEAIQEINPEATLVVTGMYNPLQGVKVVMEEETIDLGELFGYIIEATDMFYLGYAVVDGEVTFVDICDTDVKGFGDVTIKDLNDTKELAKVFYKAESKMHASKDGHAYIAEQIIGAINWNDAHTWVIGQIDEDPVHEEYCSVCGAEREAWTDCPFTDIDGHWAYNYIRYAYDHNWMNGKGDGLFAPQEASTRAMVVTMLYRMTTGDINTPYEFFGDIPFSDLEKDAWYADAMLWAADNGIVNGYEDGTCRPNKVVSREELATLIYRFADSYFLVDAEAEADLTKFKDGEKVQAWAQDAMVWAVDAGVFEGNEDGTLRPDAATLRAELATVFYRFNTKIFEGNVIFE